jgi:hypothetical protein
MAGGRRAPFQDGETLQVVIRCPVTGRAIPTGLTADPRTWNDRPIGLNRVSCPECKQIHAWNKNDAYLEGQGGSPLRTT